MLGQIAIGPTVVCESCGMTLYCWEGSITDCLGCGATYARTSSQGQEKQSLDIIVPIAGMDGRATTPMMLLSALVVDLLTDVLNVVMEKPTRLNTLQLLTALASLPSEKESFTGAIRDEARKLALVVFIGSLEGGEDEGE